MRLCIDCDEIKADSCYPTYITRGRITLRTRCEPCFRAYNAKRSRERHQRKKTDPVYLAKYKSVRRAEAKARSEREGRTYRPMGTTPSYKLGLLKSNAADAFNYWVTKRLTAKQAEQYFDRLGHQWENPRLNSDERVQLLMSAKVAATGLKETEDYATIKLSGRYAVGDCQYALVDRDMLVKISGIKWKARPNGSLNNIYAVHDDGSGKTLRMHRLVLGVGGASHEPRDVDHINGNPLDNRRCNLRLVSRSENVLNRSDVYTHTYNGSPLAVG